MPRGYFIVFQDETNREEIRISADPSIKEDSPPVEQLELIEEIQKALTGIQVIFKKNAISFNHYYRLLLSLAQAGLVGESAQPQLALRSLKEVKNEIILKEGSKIKNSYMKLLGLRAAILGMPPLVMSMIIFSFFAQLSMLSHYLLVWVGCMIGVWLSFGSRKVALSFEDLQSIEKDQVEPVLRLIFAGILSIFASLLLSTKVITAQIGSVSLSQFSEDYRVALLFGCICGISELILASRLSQKAVDIINGN